MPHPSKAIVATRVMKRPMRSIKHKLLLLFLLQALLVIVSITGVVAWSFDRGFVQYIASNNQQRTLQLASQLASVHAETGSWDALKSDRRRWVKLVMGVTGHDVSSDVEERLYEIFPASSFPSGMPAPLPLRYALIATDGTVLLGPSPNGPGRELYPIGDPSAPVGYVGVNPSEASFRSLYDLEFREQFKAGIGAAVIGAVLLALVLALNVSRRFLRPIGEVTTAARQLAAGNYSLRLDVRSTDELGRLSRDINELASALDSHEELQKRWIADISHELRTPVSLLRARLEAVQDGVRQLDRQTVDSLHDDVTRLSMIIEDLYTLSLSDTGALNYRKVAMDLSSIARHALDSLAAEFESQGLSTEFVSDPAAAYTVYADPDRLHQMLVNLLTNSARYTERGGRVRIRLKGEEHDILLQVDDSPPAVPEEDLVRIFDRLYRTDDSRSRRSGGAGLGLAIARMIIAAHDGSIVARHSTDLGGLQIEIRMSREHHRP